VELTYLLLSYLDRYMILGYLGKDALGLYSVGYNLPMYISDVIIFAMSYAVVPIYVNIYTREGKEKTEAFLSSIFHYILVFVFSICFGYFAVSRELFVVLASEKYGVAASFSTIILVGTIVLGLNNVLNAGLYLKKKTSVMLIIMLVSVATNIVLNILLLPKFELIGAAYATLLACLLAMFLTIAASFKYIFVRLRKRILLHICVSLIMLYCVTCIDIEVLWARLAVKICVGLIIAAIGWGLVEKNFYLNLRKFF